MRLQYLRPRQGTEAQYPGRPQHPLTHPSQHSSRCRSTAAPTSATPPSAAGSSLDDTPEGRAP
eukprot:11830524-Alexandrium_andersonii.AAC.1